jgi:hypothetical protein
MKQVGRSSDIKSVEQFDPINLLEINLVRALMTDARYTII